MKEIIGAGLLVLGLSSARAEGTAPCAQVDARRETAHGTYVEGAVHLADREWDEAASAFGRAIQLDPRAIGPYVALGDLYRKWRFPAEAVQVLSQGIANGQGDAAEEAELRFALGMAHYVRKDFRSAIEAFDQALEKQPDHDLARFHRAYALYVAGRQSEAVADLHAYVKSGRDDVRKQIAEALLFELIEGRP